MDVDVHAHTIVPQALRERKPAQALRYLIRVVAAGHVLLGLGCLFDMGNERPCERIAELGMPGEASQAILGKTARRLLEWEGSANE